MAIRKILLPYNFTHFDQKAVNFIIESFDHLRDIAITIFNAYTAVPEIETSSATVTGKLKGSLSYLTQKISDQENELDEVKQKFIQGGFTADKIKTVF